MESIGPTLERSGDLDKEVIVLGTARSGTSVTTHIINALGVHMDLTNAVPYESKEINAINEMMYNEIKKDTQGNILLWELPVPTRKAIEKAADKPEIQERMHNYFNGKSGVWGFKDPRLPLTINTYLPYLKNPYFVCIFRNPLESMKSWMRAFHMEEWFHKNKKEVLEAVNTYNYYLAKFINKNKDKYPFLLINYEHLLRDSSTEVRRIASFLELEPTEKAFKAVR